MRGQRIERLVQLASRFLRFPRRNLSLTDWAREFGVSKTIASEDALAVGAALEKEGLGRIEVVRGRSGGARFIAEVDRESRRRHLHGLAEQLSDPQRILPGGLIYYGDVLMNPATVMPLGNSLATLFAGQNPEVVMTSEVKGIPLGIYTAQALGVPLALCRFRNRPSDGPAVAVHYPSGTGDVRTMYMSMRQLRRGARVLIVDDFMRGGSTASGMLHVAWEFEALVVGIGVFIMADRPENKAVQDVTTLLRMTGAGDDQKRIVVNTSLP
ncbi:MAG: pur operon repressor [Synergistales bacterium]|nr:pur operon repressor [Synergistales bacterium]